MSARHAGHGFPSDHTARYTYFSVPSTLSMSSFMSSSLLKGASAGRRELPGDLVWYTQDKGLRSYEELKSRVSNCVY